MKPLFEEHGVSVFALSKDNQDEAKAHKERDQLGFVTLLSDPKMKHIRSFGLEHHKALEFKTWNVMGIPLGVPGGFKSMAIPTSILVDEDGKVRWIDQADDYRMRGDLQRIQDALHNTFASNPPRE